MATVSIASLGLGNADLTVIGKLSETGLSQTEVADAVVEGDKLKKGNITAGQVGAYSKIEVDNLLANIDIEEPDLTDYYDKTQTETLLSNKIDKGVGVVGATKTKITYNNDGIITGGADLDEADLPNISQSKITNLVSDLSNKQDTLVSGTSIKTINSSSILGSGNLALLDATNPAITGSITEQVYNLTGAEINPTNGTIQYKTVSANTTFTETLISGQSVLLRLINANSYTITFPTITWVGVVAPTLTANCAIVLWKEQSTLYGAYVGTLV